MTNYKNLIARVNARSNPEQLILEKAFESELLGVKYGDVEKFIRLAMHGVDPEYTKRIREAGIRVKKHLKEVLTDVTYRYQGSVETNTHIIATSDIDLLVISEKFWAFARKEINEILSSNHQKKGFTTSQIALLESTVKPPFFQGNASDTLLKNRLTSEQKLKKVYDHCNTTKPKSIQVENKSLKKEVDVVIASWYDNAKSVANKRPEHLRAIQIYNKDTNLREEADYTFLKIKLLNDRSAKTNGRLKKMIRFLKNMKAEINHDQKPKPIKFLKGFQFNAICYDIDLQDYKDKSIFELVAVIYLQLKRLIDDVTYRNNLKSVDGSEFIFRGKEDATTELRAVCNAIYPILVDLKKQNFL